MERDGREIRGEPSDPSDEVYRQVWRDQGRHRRSEEGERVGQDSEEQGKAVGWTTGALVDADSGAIGHAWRVFFFRSGAVHDVYFLVHRTNSTNNEVFSSTISFAMSSHE